ncbi:hypothetical protein Tco_1175431 [Tanacetum coccineum]
MIVRIKSLLDVVGITVTHVLVTAVQLKVASRIFSTYPTFIPLTFVISLKVIPSAAFRCYLKSGCYKKGKDKSRASSSSRGPNPQDICNYYKEIGDWKIDRPKLKEKALAAATAKEDSCYSGSECDLLSMVDVWLFVSEVINICFGLICFGSFSDSIVCLN